MQGHFQKSQQMYGDFDNVMIPMDSPSIYIYITIILQYCIVCIILNGKAQHSAHFD